LIRNHGPRVFYGLRHRRFKVKIVSFQKAKPLRFVALPFVLRKPMRIIWISLDVWFWTAFVSSVGISILHLWVMLRQPPSGTDARELVFGFSVNLVLALMLSVWTLPLICLILWRLKTHFFTHTRWFFCALAASMPFLFFGFFGFFSELAYAGGTFAYVFIASASATLNAWHWSGAFFKESIS
jgi:hypothetical protein